LLELDQVTVDYGPIRAVAGVTLKVEAGEAVAVLGANGAGKSSLLNAVVGLVPASGGSIRFEGDEIRRLAPEQIVRRGIALSPEGRRVFPRMSVEDNLRIGGTVQRADRAAFRAQHEFVLELFPVLRERRRQHAGTLSGGQQQMLAIGRALMARPKLLLLDEPSLGLAPVLVDQVFDLLGRLRGEGVTILVVEQNVRRALQLADRAYVLATGEVVCEGTVDEVRANAGEIEGAYLGAVA
jgi:branched-chain amino acid transport system ATP-binding protein